MKTLIEFPMPQGMTPTDLARTFNAYLIGPLAFENWQHPNGEYRHGPYQKEPPNDKRWQLDPSNDYFLNVEGSVARLGCRYNAQAPTLEALMALLKLRFPERKRASAA